MEIFVRNSNLFCFGLYQLLESEVIGIQYPFQVVNDVFVFAQTFIDTWTILVYNSNSNCRFFLNMTSLSLVCFLFCRSQLNKVFGRRFHGNIVNEETLIWQDIKLLIIYIYIWYIKAIYLFAKNTRWKQINIYI